MAQKVITPIVIGKNSLIVGKTLCIYTVSFLVYNNRVHRRYSG